MLLMSIGDETSPTAIADVNENADPAAHGIDLVAKVARPTAIEHAISNGFGFGGVNASVVFR